jgi:acyl dehydratase
MPLDASFLGRVYPPSEAYLVTRERIREFAVAIGATDPLFLDPSAAAKAGHPDVVAPPTMLILLTNDAGDKLVRDPALGLDYSRVVHADQRFAFIRPVYAGDRLVCTVVVEDVMTRAGNDFLSTRTDVSTDTGDLVAQVYSRLVSRA